MGMGEYLPVGILLVVALTFAGASLGLALWLGKRNPTPEKLAPYECGIVPLTDARERFPVKFYITAMIFVLFDIEVIFFWPWAVAFQRVGALAFLEMLIFAALLLVGYIYLWRAGGFEWER